MRTVASCELRACGEHGRTVASKIRKPLAALHLLALAAFVFLIGGCRSIHPAHSTAYFGPTEPLAEVARQINVNDTQISSLWCRIGYFEADVRQQRGGKSQFVNGTGGYLLMLKDHEDRMRLRASKAGIGTVLDVGANRDDVWLVAPPADQAWWAHRKNIGNPCMDAMPIDPLAVMQVLGVGGVDTDFVREPAPVMRFNNDRDAYMLVWQSQAKTSPSRWVARREVWYDRRSKLPELVNLFDDNGRIVVSAYLSQHQTVAGTNAKIATHYQLFFPETDSHFAFSLSEVKLSNGGFPSDRSFLFNPSHTGVHDVQQMDGNCK